MSLLSACAYLAGRFVYLCLHVLLKRSASQLPGRVALAISPQFIRDMGGRLGDSCVCVCGTNGKTTTNNLLCRVMEARGYHVVCNRKGANMPAGIASALIADPHATAACFEVDELSSIQILPQLNPRYFILLNLFRDQLDRVGEMDRVQDTLARALAASPQTQLIVCGDDPLSLGVYERLKQSGTRSLTSFGISKAPAQARGRVPEARFCQLCGAELRYASYSYAQLGDFSCPKCSFKRPVLDMSASDIVLSPTSLYFSFSVPDCEAPAQSLTANFGGLYMVYNLLAILSFMHARGIATDVLASVLKDYHPENGRLQHFSYEGLDIILNLAKNPTGFNQNISLLKEDPRSKCIYICINDNYNDGRDVSWLWDVDFERFREEKDCVLFCGGTRAHDMQVRLKYAGFDAPCVNTIDEVLERASGEDSHKPLYVLTNYSALWPIKARLEHICAPAATSPASMR